MACRICGQTPEWRGRVRRGSGEHTPGESPAEKLPERLRRKAGPKKISESLRPPDGPMQIRKLALPRSFFGRRLACPREIHRRFADFWLETSAAPNELHANGKALGRCHALVNLLSKFSEGIERK